MFIIWPRGIWLPLHGVRYSDTPLQAGIDTMPLILGFVVCGPLGGWLSDRYGSRILATGGILIAGLAAALPMTLPANFNLTMFAAYLALMGAGMGFFSAPNTSRIMGHMESHPCRPALRSLRQCSATTPSPTFIPASSLANLSPAIAARITDPHFFAGLLAQPFFDGIRVALLACVGMCVLAGVTSALRGSDHQRRVSAQAPLGDVAIVGEPVAQSR